jgi:ABC-type multidrug transport system permease subunit
MGPPWGFLLVAARRLGRNRGHGGSQDFEGQNLGSIIAVTLGLLGGVFFPLGGGDDIMSRLTYLTPHAWFLRGLGDIAGGAPWTNALPSVLALLVFTLVVGFIGWVLMKRRLAR